MFILKCPWEAFPGCKDDLYCFYFASLRQTEDFKLSLVKSSEGGRPWDGAFGTELKREHLLSFDLFVL